MSVNLLIAQLWWIFCLLFRTDANNVQINKYEQSYLDPIEFIYTIQKIQLFDIWVKNKKQIIQDLLLHLQKDWNKINEKHTISSQI